MNWMGVFGWLIIFAWVIGGTAAAVFLGKRF